jgi:hypothetical protein
MKSGGYFVNILDFSGVHSSVVLALGEALCKKEFWFSYKN